jgi:DNA-binding NtrC family response regulator
VHARGQSLIVLVAEDETIIALDLEDMLTAAGYVVGGTFATRSAALAWLEGHQPDGAIIDIVLGDGPCTDLVRKLMARGVPTLLYSGVDDIPTEFRELARVPKPAMTSEVRNTLDRLLLGNERVEPRQRPTETPPQVNSRA